MNTVAQPRSESRAAGRLVPALCYLAGGLAIFFFGSPYYDIFPTNDNLLFNAALAAGLGGLALAARSQVRTARFWPSLYALFVASAANLVLVIGPFNRLMTADDPYRLMAQDKLAQFLAVVPVVVGLSWLARREWGWIYLQRGRPRRWLPVGLAGLAFGAAAGIAMGFQSGLDGRSLATAAPWVLAFVALNALMEELWFRAVFMRPYAADLGAAGAIVVTALVFGASHINATYLGTGEALPFGLVVFTLGVILAWTMRWSDTLWGSVLVHMGADLLIILPIIQSI